MEYAKVEYEAPEKILEKIQDYENEMIQGINELKALLKG